MKLSDKKLPPRSPERRSRLGKLLFDRGVRDTSSLKRITNLPRRQWVEDPDFAETLSAYLRTADGTMVLRPFQATALTELHDFSGAFISGRVGIGKTLVSYLAPLLLEAKRPLLLIPAKLRGKTERDFAELAEHWHPAPMTILSYEKLSRDSAAQALEELRPDLIISDECHRLKNRKAAVTRRVLRWMHDHPETRFVAMSGTVANRSLKDFAHILVWCLGQELSPLPTQFNELAEWCLAVDEALPPNQFRLPAGALEQLMSAEDRAEPDPVKGLRCAIRRRIEDTPGCVMTSSEYLGASLQIDSLEAVTYNAEILRSFDILRTDWTTPDGRPFSDPISVWRHARELALGFWYKWDPEPPAQWMEARKLWARVCRWIIESNRSQLDSELQVVNAVTAGFWADRMPTVDGMPMGSLKVGEVLAIWQAIKPAFTPNTVAVWEDETILRQIYKSEERIYWVEHRAVGEKLSEQTGAPYFGQQGKAADGSEIEDARGPVIASIAANSEGRNLQRWHEQIVLAPPANGKAWEQLLGRTHRDGQQADEVHCTLLMTCEEHWSAWEQAQADAAFIESTTGQPQKILRSDVSVEEPERTPPRFRS